MKLNNADDIQKLREAINENLAGIGEELGVLFEADRCTMARDGESCSMKVEIRLVDAEPKNVKEFKRNWGYYAHFGLRLDHLNAEVTLSGRRMKLVGINIGASRHPLICEDTTTGKQYGYTPDIIRHLPKLPEGGAA